MCVDFEERFIDFATRCNIRKCLLTPVADVELFFYILVTEGLRIIVPNSFSSDWSPRDNISTCDSLLCLACDVLNTSGVSSPGMHLLLLLCSRHKIETGTIHKVYWVPLPSKILSGVVSPHFENSSAVSTSTLSPSSFFTCLCLDRLELKSYYSSTLPPLYFQYDAQTDRVFQPVFAILPVFSAEYKQCHSLQWAVTRHSIYLVFPFHSQS